MRNRIKASVVGLAAVLTLSGCNLLDVNNPNNLVEESIRQEAAASAVVNGALSLTAAAVSNIWQPYLVASDEMYWIGSRDAWLSLDQGSISDPTNEFTDGAFPSVGQARWMGDEAIDILTQHVADNPSADMKQDLARANLFSGMMYTVIGEVMADFAFSNKKEAGPAVGDMKSVLDDAITRFDAAIAGGDSDVKLKAMAMKARAMQSKAIRGASGVVNSGASSIASQVLSMVPGPDWRYDFTYSASTVSDGMASWVNDRKENQFDLSLVTVDAANDISGIALMDPIDNVADPVVKARLEHWKQGAFDSKGGPYSPLTMTSARLMHLILAEDALAGGDEATFTTHINHIRDMDGLTPYSGQIPALDMLQHERRVNTMIMGLRLSDMYRFGVKDPKWLSGSDAVVSPWTLLPITCIEIRANPNLTGNC